MLRLIHSTTTDPANADADETAIDVRPPANYEQRLREELTQEKEKRARVAALRPTWAKALIVAELEHDASDSMTDYFNTTTSRIVALAWSAHTRDLFAELRKAAARFPETAHLGPICDVFTARVVLVDDVVSGGSAYWKGSPSHWHRELYGDASEYRDTAGPFATRAAVNAFIANAPAPEPITFNGSMPEEKLVRFEWQIRKESIEHREKYSMGHGYYLKASTRYSSGWIVRKIHPDNINHSIELDLIAAPAPAPPRTPTRTEPTAASVTFNAEKNGVEIRFPSKPPAAVLETLKANGWRWSRFAGCWYHRDTPDARAFADTLTTT